MSQIRIGDPRSPVPPGASVPGKEGSFYESGQFAPDLDELSTATLAEADKSGLIDRDLPFFTDGQVDEDKIDNWNYQEDFAALPVKLVVSDTLPKFAAASLLTVAKNYKFLPKLVGLSAILNGQPQDDQQQQALFDKVALGGQPLVGVNTSYIGRIFKSKLVVYPAYFQFVSIPLVPAIPNYSTGLSVANYATISAMGFALLSKLSYEGRLDYIGAFSEVSGWTKSDQGDKGSFLGRKNPAFWTRNKKEYTTEIANFSMPDDFADTFAQYITHQYYLKRRSPEKFEYMQNLLTKYGGISDVL